MTQRHLRRFVLFAAGASFVAGSAVLAQTALAQLKVTDAEAREYVLNEFRNSSSCTSGALEPVAQRAYVNIPPAARGAVTTGLYAWTKAYVNTPAFKTAYAAMRKDATPEPRVHAGTVEQEVKALMDAEKAELEKSAKELEAAGMKTQAAAIREQGRVMFSNPVYATGKRMDVEEKRTADKKDYEIGMASWSTQFPADPMVRVAGCLREFVTVTADVDFAAKRSKQDTEAGPAMMFVNDAYNRKPWQWQLSYLFGPETTAAARAAAQAWLRELGK